MKLIFCLAVCFCLFLTGCGFRNGNSEITVTGEVKYEESPIESGRIFFRHIDGDQRGAAGEIKNGQYSLRTAPGKVRVEVVASRPIPGKFDHSNGTPEQVGEMYIPKKFNTDSKLTAEVTPGRANSISFNLTND